MEEKLSSTQDANVSASWTSWNNEPGLLSHVHILEYQRIEICHSLVYKRSDCKECPQCSKTVNMITGTNLPSIGINPEFQSFGMCIVGEIFDPWWECLPSWNQGTLAIELWNSESNFIHAFFFHIYIQLKPPGSAQFMHFIYSCIMWTLIDPYNKLFKKIWDNGSMSV
jgi:hypothetical protein